MKNTYFNIRLRYKTYKNAREKKEEALVRYMTWYEKENKMVIQSSQAENKDQKQAIREDKKCQHCEHIHLPLCHLSSSRLVHSIQYEITHHRFKLGSGFLLLGGFFLLLGLFSFSSGWLVFFAHCDLVVEWMDSWKVWKMRWLARWEMLWIEKNKDRKDKSLSLLPINAFDDDDVVV